MSPRTASSVPTTLVQLDPAAGAPAYRQIADSLREVAGVMDATRDAVEESRRAGRDLSETAARLTELVRRFTV